MSYGIPRDRRIQVPSTDRLCEDCDNPATWEVTGEVDSFGYETLDLCDLHRDEVNGGSVGPCDICGNEEGTVRSKDPEEGYGGPVYIRCSKHYIVAT